jgi:hypothetical protein
MSEVINLKDRKNKTKEKKENTDKERQTNFAAEIEHNKKLAAARRKARFQENENVKSTHRLRTNDPNNKR